MANRDENFPVCLGRLLVWNIDFSGRKVEKCFSSERTIITAFRKIKAQKAPECFNSLLQYSLLLKNGLQATRAFEASYEKAYIYISNLEFIWG